MIKIIDCPRDAMQGHPVRIPTQKKIEYIQALLDLNCPILDCGSFVSPRSIPQMADTHEVLKGLDLSKTLTALSVITANESGAKKAAAEEKVAIMGYPFSVSEKFQQYNTNCSREEAIKRIENIQTICANNNKQLMVYLSMGFGNPYEEEWNVEMTLKWVKQLIDLGIESINLSDTIGAAKADDIALLFKTLIAEFPQIEFGAHFHSAYDDWFPKVNTAYENGCRKFDGAIQGLGGCPLSKSKMVGNIPTEKLVSFANQKNEPHSINALALESVFNKALTLFQVD